MSDAANRLTPTFLPAVLQTIASAPLRRICFLAAACRRLPGVGHGEQRRAFSHQGLPKPVIAAGPPLPGPLLSPVSRPISQAHFPGPSPGAVFRSQLFPLLGLQQGHALGHHQ